MISHHRDCATANHPCCMATWHLGHGVATEWQERPACESLQRTDSFSVGVSVGPSPLVCFSRTALSPGFPLGLSEPGHLSGTAAVEPSLSQMCRMLGCAQRHGQMCTCVHKPLHFFLPGQLTGGSLWEEVDSARGRFRRSGALDPPACLWMHSGVPVVQDSGTCPGHLGHGDS